METGARDRKQPHHRQETPVVSGPSGESQKPRGEDTEKGARRARARGAAQHGTQVNRQETAQHESGKGTAGPSSSSKGDTEVSSSASPSRAKPQEQHGTDIKRDSSRPWKSRARGAKFNPSLTAPDPKDVSSSKGAPSDVAPQEPAAAAATHESGASTLTTGQGQVEHSEKRRRKPRPKHFSQPPPDDLTSTLIRALSTRPFPDCPICFSPVHPAQPIWSCSPATPQVLVPASDGSTPAPQYCWTTFHLKCVRSWAEKSVKALEEAWRNRGEMGKKGEWRCPGCQAKREIVPTSYWCFCNSTPDPKPARLATPHSCGNPCSRVREAGCGHQCPLLCHPGPCPPCRVTMQLTCPCPKQKVVSFRCGDEFSSGKGKGKEDLLTGGSIVSCGSICGKPLDCGIHSCEKICHPSPCDVCELRKEVTCSCGKTKKEVKCGEGAGVFSAMRVLEGQDAGSCLGWIGRFQCEQICDRLFDCQIHRCQKVCHRQLMEAAPCPFSPSKIIHCPCGRNAIAPPDADNSGKYPFPPRRSCTEPIPTCESVCGKVHSLCGHVCSTKCHVGPCPPCSVTLVRPCRCGLTTREIRCSELFLVEGEKEIMCDRPCTVLRACGKHECRRLCCPLASLAIGKGKKGRAAEAAPTGIGEEEGGLHECDLICGRMLTCGNHTCEKKDHKGPCPSCLRSSFEEAICPCGRTILDPPIPCGTKVNCSYQCPRIPPCAHPPISHTCHEDPPPCPPCVYLTTKLCACGKKEIVNVKCSLERDKVSCAAICGRLSSCGFHRCQRLCHAGDCGACTTPCGKDHKLCLPAHHPCTRPCHAPSACPEEDPCQAVVTLTCPCGRLTQAAKCGRSSLSESDSSSRPLVKCTNQCEVAKRNARLAEALGITSETREKASKGMAGGPVTYSDEVVAFAKDDPKFMSLVEKTFAEFIASNKRSQVLPHMPPEKRKFVHGLAAVYRLDTQMIDQEPLRSVQIVRRLDTRVPTPLLSATVVPAAAPAPNFGKLGLSMGTTTTTTGAWRATTKSTLPAPAPLASGTTALGSRGWGSNIRTAPSPAAGSTTVAAPTPASTSSDRVLNSRSTTPYMGVRTEGDANVPDNWEDDLC